MKRFRREDFAPRRETRLPREIRLGEDLKRRVLYKAKASRRKPPDTTRVATRAFAFLGRANQYLAGRRPRPDVEERESLTPCPRERTNEAKGGGC